MTDSQPVPLPVVMELSEHIVAFVVPLPEDSNDEPQAPLDIEVDDEVPDDVEERMVTPLCKTIS